MDLDGGELGFAMIAEKALRGDAENQELAIRMRRDDESMALLFRFLHGRYLPTVFHANQTAQDVELLEPDFGIHLPSEMYRNSHAVFLGSFSCAPSHFNLFQG